MSLGLGMGLGMGQNVAAVSGGGGGAWYTTLSATVDAFYDDDITTQFSDAGTTQVTTSGTVQQWNSKVGTRHLKQATAGNRPTRQTGGLHFDGAGDTMKTDTGLSPWQDVSGNSWFALTVNADNFTAVKQLAVLAGDSGHDWLKLWAAFDFSGKPEVGSIYADNSGDFETFGSTLSAGTQYVVTAILSTSELTVRVNGTESKLALTGKTLRTGDTGAFWLNPGGDSPCVTRKAIVGHGILSSGDRTTIETNMAL